MDLSLLKQVSEFEWEIEPNKNMRVPGIIFGDEALVSGMDLKVYEQVCNVATLPGIQKASYAMPDAHWGYGFPIGGVAAFDPEKGGVISAGGVGFDISCGVRTLHTGLKKEDLSNIKERLADALFQKIPSGVGSRGKLHLDDNDMDAMLTGGAKWAVREGFGVEEDLDRIEENGCMKGANPEDVSTRAKDRQRDEMGTLGSGNHYLETQEVVEIYDLETAEVYGIEKGDIVLSIHCGSRGLGHQIGTEFLKNMLTEAPRQGLLLPDRDLACTPIKSDLGRSYLGAMRSAINCALANRQIITHLARATFSTIAKTELSLLYDVSHNTCKLEQHNINGKSKSVYVHRKGATRALGPGHPDLPRIFQKVGQPVLIGGTMGTESYILAGTEASMDLAFGSAVHGAGRRMSRNQASKQWKGKKVVDYLAEQGVLIRSVSYRGVAEEAPGAYKKVSTVVNAADQSGLSRRVARLKPVICVKG